MLRYVVGEPAKVYCAGRRGLVSREGYDLHDCSSAVVTFQNGVIANVFTGCYLTALPPLKTASTSTVPTARWTMYCATR